MRRLPVVRWAAIVATVVLAGCGGAGAPAGRVPGGGRSPATAAPSGPATATSPPGTSGLLHGDYQAWAIAFPAATPGSSRSPGPPGRARRSGRGSSGRPTAWAALSRAW